MAEGISQADMKTLMDRLDAQDKLLKEQKDKNDDASKIIVEQASQIEVLSTQQSNLQAGALVSRDNLRENQKLIELAKHKGKPAVQHNLGLLFDLQYLTIDALESWKGFIPEVGELQKIDELPADMINADNMEVANAALVSSSLLLSQLLERVKEEIFLNEAVSSSNASFGIIPLLKGESSKFSGENKEEQEAYAARVKSAQREWQKTHPAQIKNKFGHPSGYKKQRGGLISSGHKTAGNPRAERGGLYGSRGGRGGRKDQRFERRKSHHCHQTGHFIADCPTAPDNKN